MRGGGAHPKAWRVALRLCCNEPIRAVARARAWSFLCACTRLVSASRLRASGVSPTPHWRNAFLQTTCRFQGRKNILAAVCRSIAPTHPTRGHPGRSAFQRGEPGSFPANDRARTRVALRLPGKTAIETPSPAPVRTVPLMKEPGTNPGSRARPKPRILRTRHAGREGAHLKRELVAADAALCAAFVLLSKPYNRVCNRAALSAAGLRRGVSEEESSSP